MPAVFAMLIQTGMAFAIAAAHITETALLKVRKSLLMQMGMEFVITAMHIIGAAVILLTLMEMASATSMKRGTAKDMGMDADIKTDTGIEQANNR